MSQAQEVTLSSGEQQVQEANSELGSEEVEIVITKTPVVWGNLVQKLRQVNGETNREQVQNSSQENSQENSQKVKPRGFGNRNFNSGTRETVKGKNPDRKGSFKNCQDKPRLSGEKFEQELNKCKKTFYTHLNEYLKEEVQMEVKTENPDSKKQSGPKLVKKTNLQRIQDGMVTLNVLRAMRDREFKSYLQAHQQAHHQLEQTESKQITYDDFESGLVFLDELVANRRMNFVFELAEYLAKFNIVITQRGKTLMAHSVYLKL